HPPALAVFSALTSYPARIAQFKRRRRAGHRATWPRSARTPGRAVQGGDHAIVVRSTRCWREVGSKLRCLRSAVPVTKAEPVQGDRKSAKAGNGSHSRAEPEVRIHPAPAERPLQTNATPIMCQSVPDCRRIIAAIGPYGETARPGSRLS